MKRASGKSSKRRDKKQSDEPAAMDEGMLLSERLRSALSGDAIALLPARKTKTKITSVPIAEKQALTLREASAISGYTNEFLLEAIRSGHLIAEKISGRWSLKRDDLNEWMKRL